VVGSRHGGRAWRAFWRTGRFTARTSRFMAGRATACYTGSKRMDAELIAVSGSRLGEHYTLGSGDLRIGRADNAHIRIDELGVAAEHCVIRPVDGRYEVSDRHTGSGTYVNGMRISRQNLEPGDQIGVGETILVFREG